MPSSTLGARLRAVLAGTAITAGTLLLVAPSAHAAPAAGEARSSSTATRHHATWGERFDRRAARVLAVARNQKGDPYQYGAAGPNAFDCSGLVMYSFRRGLNRSLPHNAAQQYQDSTHIKRSAIRPGDLVFVDNGGYISHVGIFAGHGYWWVAPHSGTRVQKQRIYSAHLLFGRVIHPNANR
jgi:cell wall-associated NlpC family hydrolase